MASELHLEYSPDHSDRDTVEKARRTLAQLAARRGLAAEELHEVMAMLGLVRSQPADWRYTPEGKRVRPCNQRQEVRQRVRQQSAEARVDGGDPPDPPDAA